MEAGVSVGEGEGGGSEAMNKNYIDPGWTVPRAEFYDRMHCVAMTRRSDRWDANAKLLKGE